jgi:hypothetical protein
MSQKRHTTKEKLDEIKMKHECALKQCRKKCCACELGIIDGAIETIQSLQEKVNKSQELLESK